MCRNRSDLSHSRPLRSRSVAFEGATVGPDCNFASLHDPRYVSVMKRFALLTLALTTLACSGVKRDADAALRAEARTRFITACGSTATPAVCTCAADEILRTHTTKELLAYAADPNAKEVVQVVATCAKRLSR